VEEGFDGLLGGEDVGYEGERESHGGGGGGGGGVVVREPEEAVGGENEEAGFEEREVGDVVAFEVDGREDGTLDFVWEKDRSTAACEVCFWEIVCCH